MLRAPTSAAATQIVSSCKNSSSHNSTHNEGVGSADAVKSVIERFELSIYGVVQQIVDVLLYIFCTTTTALVTVSMTEEER